LTKSAVEKLEERGYWRVEIRPADYVARRVDNINQLRQQLEACRVQLRGWDFPHLPRDWDVPDSQKSIGLETDWSGHVEVWRAFLSGQFVYRGGVWTDWLDQHFFHTPDPEWPPGSRLPIVDSVWHLTEFFEFAVRWSQSEVAADVINIDISFHGLAGRRLFSGHEQRAWFAAYGPAKAKSFSVQHTVPRTALIAEAKAMAVNASEELFQLFGYAPTAGLIATLQEELFDDSRR
jgi:hypothetical protein